MSIKQYLFLMAICTLLCWLGFWLVLFFINPETTASLGFILFYASLFFALVGTLTLASYFFRVGITRAYSKKDSAHISFRQSVFLSVVIVVALFLQANHLLTWLNAILLALLITLIEFLVISLSHQTTNSLRTWNPNLKN